MNLDALPTCLVTDPASEPALIALWNDFLHEYYPFDDAVERLLALSELAHRLEVAALPGVTVHWTGMEFRP